MNHNDHVALLRDGVSQTAMPQRWADLGAGGGAFTLALAELLGGTGEIVAVDRDHAALRDNARAMHARFPDAAARYETADMTRWLPDAPLDGVVMANALHFLREREQGAMLDHIRGILRPGGRLLLVEYNAERGNVWVPHPLTYGGWERLAARHGFVGTCLLARRPSRFLHEIYAASSDAPEQLPASA